jgi:hypothetical protein
MGPPRQAAKGILFHSRQCPRECSEEVRRTTPSVRSVASTATSMTARVSREV